MVCANNLRAVERNTIIFTILNVPKEELASMFATSSNINVTCSQEFPQQRVVTYGVDLARKKDTSTCFVSLSVSLSLFYDSIVFWKMNEK